MKSLSLIAILFAATINAAAQSAPASSSITGRVTVGDKPAPGVIVLMTRAPADPMKNFSAIFESRPVVRVTTDGEGVYRFDHVAAGRYSLSAYAPAFVTPQASDNWLTGKVVNVTDGQAVEHQDFALTRGGVITGRVLDVQGRPVVGQMITLTPADEGKRATPTNPMAAMPFGNTMYRTDDRGVYRIYGLAAGRYLVSLGASAMGLGALGKQRYNEPTYHPGVTDKAKAAVVEIKEGAEVAGIDIRLGLASQTYKVSGRVIDAASGKSFTGAAVNYGAAEGDAKMVSPRALGTTPNARGEFQLDAIIPGKYHAFAWFDDDSEFYSDAAPFEITTADVSGVVVKVHRGQTVSGTVIIEGESGGEAQSQLAGLQLMAYNRGEEVSAPRQLTARIAPDGSFRLTGVQPGHLNIYTNTFFEPTKLVVLRTERGGLPQKDGVQVRAGESVNDIRVLLASASGKLRGEIKPTGDGSLDDYDVMITAMRVGSEEPFSRMTQEVDADGRFTIEDLIPGDYEVTVQVGEAGASDKGRKLATTKQRVTVTKDSEASVTLTIELPAKKGKSQ
ncbi:MAG TPA: carboxypeptidase regulatory-like domain-containing protein [Blastocatellia bacterium]|nr:carboxypeptidase regulatory-like domain-containing protein [Blastocatellia bacterium]